MSFSISNLTSNSNSSCTTSPGNDSESIQSPCSSTPQVSFLTKTSIPFDVLAKVVRELNFVETHQKYSPLDPQGDKLLQFITGLLRETKPTANIILVCAVYFRRIHSVYPDWVASFPSCLLFTGCLILAFKFVQDAPHNYGLWTAASGFKPKVLNKVEHSLLELLNYELYVSFEHHEIWLQHILNTSQLFKPPPTVSSTFRARAAVRGRPRRASSPMIMTYAKKLSPRSGLRPVSIAPLVPITVRHSSYGLNVHIPSPKSHAHLSSHQDNNSIKMRAPLSSIYSQIPAHHLQSRPNTGAGRSNRSFCVLPPITSLQLNNETRAGIFTGRHSYPYVTPPPHYIHTTQNFNTLISYHRQPINNSRHPY